METQIKDLKISEVAKQMSVSQGAVLSWVRSGALKAYSVARSETARPIFRVTQSALDAFKNRRLYSAGNPGRPKKKSALSKEVELFF
jgi:hypothetical protein